MTSSRLLPALLLATAALAACQSSAPTPAASPAPTSAAPSTHAPVPATPTPSPTGGPTGDAAASGECTLDELQPSLGRTTGEAGQRHTAVVWVNTSDRTCTMTGFGGVDLQGPDHPLGPIYSLPRQQEEPTTVRLAPGGTAHSTITWLPPQDGSGWTPDRMLVTPPDETRSAAVEWPGGAVLRQDGATRPGTYLSPVRPGVEG